MDQNAPPWVLYHLRKTTTVLSFQMTITNIAAMLDAKPTRQIRRKMCEKSFASSLTQIGCTTSLFRL